MFSDPTNGETRPRPPTYGGVGNVAAGYVSPDGTPAHGNSTPDQAGRDIGDVDANQKPAEFTNWEEADFDTFPTFHDDFNAGNHTHPAGDIHEQTTHTRTATLPTGEEVTIEERSTTYESDHPPEQDPPPRDGELVTVTTTSVSLKAWDAPAKKLRNNAPSPASVTAAPTATAPSWRPRGPHRGPPLYARSGTTSGGHS